MKDSKNKELLWFLQIDLHEHFIAFDSRCDRCESIVRQIDDEMLLTASANWSWMKNLWESRNVNQNRELTRKTFASMCRFEDLEFDRFESKWDRRIEIWCNANLYENQNCENCIRDCIYRSCAKTTICFDVIANQMNWNFRRTCDVNHSWSNEILIEDRETSESTISECRFRLLDISTRQLFRI